MLTLADTPNWFLTSLALVLGLLFGSFLNVVIYRWPREQSVVSPASRCPGCGKNIRARNNIPVISWLLLRGRARCCGFRIPIRYPLVELLGGLVSLAVLNVFVLGLPESTPIPLALLVFGLYLGLGLGLIAAAFIDLEHMLLPDAITLGGTALGLLSTPVRLECTLPESLIGAAAGFLIIYLPFDLGYRWLRGHPGMGLGDAKLVMLAGAWFGLPGAIFTLLAGAVQGTLVALSLFVANRRIDEPEAVTHEREAMLRTLQQAAPEERAALLAEFEKDPIFSPPKEGLAQARIAFGPFLVIGCLEYMLFGPWLISLLLGPL